jgi:hypothetical protein
MPVIAPNPHLAILEIVEYWFITKHQAIFLPIKKLDGVMVKIRLQIDWAEYEGKQDLKIVMVIDTPLKVNNDGDSHNINFFNHHCKGVVVHKDIVGGWNCEMMQLSIIGYFEMMGKLKYNKLLDKFVIPESSCIEKYHYEVWGGLDGVEMEGEICCVCHEITTSKTDCDHSLCLQCWSKLKKEDPPDPDEYMVGIKGHKCPICRDFMGFYN